MLSYKLMWAYVVDDEPTLIQCLFNIFCFFDSHCHIPVNTRRLAGVDITLTNVGDVGPTLNHHWVNVRRVDPLNPCRARDLLLELAGYFPLRYAI